MIFFEEAPAFQKSGNIVGKTQWKTKIIREFCKKQTKTLQQLGKHNSYNTKAKYWNTRI